MAQKPYKSGILNAIHAATNRSPAIKSSTPRQVPMRTIDPAYFALERQNRQPALMVNDELQMAMKAMPFNQFISDFINDNGGSYAHLYNEDQLEQAYRTSVYMFAAIRRVASLMNEVKFRGEVRHKGEWRRLPESHKLNRMLDETGPRFLFEMYILYALFGSVLIYKHKTRKGVHEFHRGKTLNYLDGGVSGFHIIRNAYWTMEEDTYSGKIKGFNLTTADEAVGQRSRLLPEEVIYIHDFDPRRVNDGTSMASLAINNAVTNAAIARWAAHYFMSGAMPLLLVSQDQGASGKMPPAEAMRFKNQIEQMWQGIWGKFSVRAMFTERKLNVEQAGIEAEKVQAPELNRDALNAISSVFQIAPDLIVPPEGGSDNARHKHLMMAAYTDAVLPVGRIFAAGIGEGLGFDSNTPVRIVVAEEYIRALEADRMDVATTETTIFNAGVQTYGETQERLRSKPIPELADFINVNGRVQSVKRLLRDDMMASADILQYLPQSWENGGLLLSEYRQLMFGLGMPVGVKDGFKHEVVPDPASGMPPAFPGNPTPPDNPEPPQLPPSSPPPEADPVPEGMPAGDSVKDADIRQDDDSPVPVQTVAPGREEEFTEQYVSGIAIAGADQSPSSIQMKDPLPAASGVSVIFEGDPELLIDGEETEPEESEDPGCAYVIFDLSNDPLIHVAVNALRKAMGTAASSVEWTAPESWHCTLVYAPTVPDEALGHVLKLLPAQVMRPALHVNGLRLFDTPAGFDAPAGLCITLCIENDNALDTLQAGIRTRFEAYRLPISEYSQSGNYKPHVTLGYAPADFPHPSLDCHFVLEPKAMNVNRDDYQIIRSIPAIYDLAELIRDHVEPDGTDMIIDSNSRSAVEDLQTQMMQRRQRIIDAVLDEKPRIDAVLAGTVEPETLPPDVLLVLREAWGMMPLPKNTERLLVAYCDAVNAGDLDLHTQTEENPVLERLTMKQKAFQQTPEDELKAWRKAALRNPTKALKRFEIKSLPLSIEKTVRAQLQDAGTKVEIAGIFDNALEALQAETAIPDATDDMFATWAERMQGDPDLASLVQIEDEEPNDDEA